MKIIYIPIDERPCNTTVVERIASTNSEIELVTPPKTILGYKKKPANTEKLWDWINNKSSNADGLILSIDMLIYGGLLPSRIHYLPREVVSIWLERLKSFRQSYPKLQIYASNLIMRTPKYSSSDEEPDYYEEWGRDIFLRSYLEDKQKKDGLSNEEVQQLKNIQQRLPKHFIQDYETRRRFNLSVNLSVLDLVKEGTINFLAIPQDDSAEYGYTAIDQNVIIKKREALRLYHRVQIYPGADEVGATLLARIFNDVRGEKPRIYPIWSSTLGPELIPMYEDRPFGESLKSHVIASGCQLVNDSKTAELILAYNTPGRVMQESWNQTRRDITYTSYRNLLQFVDQIKQFINQGKNVVVADSAYANGGDIELIRLLDEEGILDKLISYKGWNTNCNTLGTTISQGVIGSKDSFDKLQENLIYHLLDDYFYQSEIRMEMVEDFLAEHQLNYFDLKNKAELVNKERNKRLIQRFSEEIKNSFLQVNLEEVKTFAPWNRMFECGIELKIILKLDK
ncbi:DUF4127 family protein [Caldibacillus thermoamylovorans]|uniref:DUF4127 family protein n=1 Tax=Caldibacillus thermoamylovorans TaxID=35841 RepID=UPI00203F4DA4|nr:DUF4127 family protein [Caldibacillus thermoamylovorans]MCM3478555.1 DUF4127 family protein [Caldibacillus thermoamylovorans]